MVMGPDFVAKSHASVRLFVSAKGTSLENALDKIVIQGINKTKRQLSKSLAPMHYHRSLAAREECQPIVVDCSCYSEFLSIDGYVFPTQICHAINYHIEQELNDIVLQFARLQNQGVIGLLMLITSNDNPPTVS
jgi:hypothetical protein